MKTIHKIAVFVMAIAFLGTNAQEKKIKFSKGVLKICSSKNFQIEGYNGNEVIIKSLHKERGNRNSYAVFGNATGKSYSYSTSSNGKLAKIGKREKSDANSKKGAWEIKPGVVVSGYAKNNDSIKSSSVVFFNDNSERKKGLKKLGKKSNNADLGIYFTIEQKDGELVFKDQHQAGFIMSSNERYEIKIPNSLKLQWATNNCSSRDRTGEYRFFSSSNPSSLSNFDGEVEISSTVGNIKLVDVTGPAVINTIGGNVTVEFDKKYPKNLYSIYTNNGFIDMQIPSNSNLLVDVIGKSVYSDVDFKVLEEEEVNDVWQKTTKMKLKLGSGKTKMKLNGGFGEVFLRKK